MDAPIVMNAPMAMDAPIVMDAPVVMDDPIGFADENAKVRRERWGSMPAKDEDPRWELRMPDGALALPHA